MSDSEIPPAPDLTTSGSLSLDYSSPYWRDDFRTGAWSPSVLDRNDALSRCFHPTLLHALVASAKHGEDLRITLLPERERDQAEQRSYTQLYERARRLAGGLARLGVQPGDRVLIVLPTCHDFLAIFFACQMCGAVAVPAYPPDGFRVETGLKRLAHIARHSGSRVCVTWPSVAPLLGDIAHTAKSMERVINVEELEGARLPKTHRVDTDDPAFIQYTSGSTGQPKGVVLTHRNLITNIHAMGQALRINDTDVLVGWCPLYHDMGLIGTFLSAVYWRLPLVLLSPMAFLQKPHRWLRAMSDYGGTISPAPNFGYALAVRRVKETQREGLDLSTWRVALNGAEPVTRDAVTSFQETYAPYGFSPNAVMPVYGLAEGSLAVSFPDPGTPVRYATVDRARLAEGYATPLGSGKAAHFGTTLACVGRAVPGHSVRVIVANGRSVGENMVGHVITTGGSVMAGYFQDKDATDACLQHGWLQTGDLGFVRDGELYICGRAKDLIIVRGRNYHAEDLEQSAEEVPGARKGSVVAFGVFDEELGSDRVVLVVESKETDEALRQRIAEQVSQAVIEGTGLPVDEVVVVPPGTVPKTSSGKRQRQRCKLAYLNDELTPQTPGRLDIGLAYVRSKAGGMRMQTRRLRRALGGERDD